MRYLNLTLILTILFLTTGCINHKESVTPSIEQPHQQQIQECLQLD